MKRQLIVLWMGMFLVVLGSGCSPAKHPNVNPVSSNGNGRILPQPQPSQPPQSLTITDIFTMYDNGQFSETIDAIDIFLETRTSDDDRKALLNFLMADAYRQLKNYSKASEVYEKIVKDYPLATWEYTPGKLADIKDLCEIGKELASLSDRRPFPETSEQFTTLAWDCYNKGKYISAILFAQTCINRFREQAALQQVEHANEYQEKLPKLDPKPRENEEIIQKYWALYDVGTSCFIKGQCYEKRARELVNKTNGAEVACKLYNQAIAQYNEVKNNYAGAQCYDKDGPWYWSVKKGAVDRISLLKLVRMPEIKCTVEEANTPQDASSRNLFLLWKVERPTLSLLILN